ncbi:hypothetical protein OG613_46680 (plasmid) [Streptomyces sp. NBC_00015]|uniref:hypothetical protein n=1 Tax=Streptomyces sp. NBC_00015 TaxID=2903611 RepID=UPI002F90BCD7
MADEFRFVALRAFARPPRRLVVVPYVEALWVRWAAAGLGALRPFGATVETIRPGVIDRALGDLEGYVRRQSETLVRAEPWHHHEVLEVEGARTLTTRRSRLTR